MSIADAAREVIDWSKAFADTQGPDGSARGYGDSGALAVVALENVTVAYDKLCSQLGGRALESFELFDADASAWRSNGLQNAPNFRETHNHWRPSQSPDEFVPFLGPIRIPNGIRGGSFILNAAIARGFSTPNLDLIEQVTQVITNPKDVVILDAPYRSNGYSLGEGSVLFSELLASEKRRGPQTFGAFIVTDFLKSFDERTKHAPIQKGLELVRLLNFEPHTDPAGERAVWLQVHDRFHDLGALPHAEFLPSKMLFSTAILDELKADGSSYLALRKNSGDWGNVGARHVIDKMFRFPFSPYGYTSVDGAVGEFLFREAVRTGALYQSSSETIDIDLGTLDNCIQSIVEKVLAIEDMASIQTEDYQELAIEYLGQVKVAQPPYRQPLRWHDVKNLAEFRLGAAVRNNE